MPVQKREPMAHQETAVQYAMSRRNPAFIMEMRLGKTLSAIWWVQNLSKTENVRSVVVIAPITVLEAWEKELSLEGEQYVTIHGMSKTDKARWCGKILNGKTRKWILLNYQTLLYFPEIAALPWHIVIADESTRIRNPKAKTTTICTKGFRLAKHRAILTGLPAPESELDFFCQFQFLDGTFMGFDNYWRFRQEYFQPDSFGYGWAPKPHTRKRIKEIVHYKGFVLSRKDVNLGSKKIYEQRYAQMNSEQKRLYKKAEREFATDTPSGAEKEIDCVLTQQMWLARLAGGFDVDARLISREKIGVLLELLKEDLKGEPVVVWFRFTSEIEEVRKALFVEGIRCGIIQGSVDREERKAISEDFRNGKFQVLLLQVQTAQFGIDLSVSSTAIYFSNLWSCEIRLQSEDRIVHPKKKEPLLYIDLVTKGTIDEEVVGALQDKSFNAKFLMQKILRGAYERQGISK